MKRAFFSLLLVLFFFNILGQTVSKCSVVALQNLISNNKDDLLVINFWATYCRPCVQELPSLIKTCNSFKEKKIKLILVSVDAKELYPKKIMTFSKRHHFKAEIKWLDETNANYFCPAIDPSWTGSIPATLFINNKNGNRDFVESEMTESELKQKIIEMLGM